MRAKGRNGRFVGFRTASFLALAVLLLSGCATAPSRPSQFAPVMSGPPDEATTAEIRRHAQEAQEAAVGVTFLGSS